MESSNKQNKQKIDQTESQQFTPVIWNEKRQLRNSKAGKQFQILCAARRYAFTSNLVFARSVASGDNSSLWVYFCPTCFIWIQLFDEHVCPCVPSYAQLAIADSSFSSQREYLRIFDTLYEPSSSECECLQAEFFCDKQRDLLYDKTPCSVYLRRLRELEDLEIRYFGNRHLQRQFFSVMDSIEAKIDGITPPDCWVSHSTNGRSKRFRQSVIITDDYAIIDAANNPQFWGKKWYKAEAQGKSLSTVHREKHHGHTWKQCLLNPNNVGYFHTMCPKCRSLVKRTDVRGVCSKCTHASRHVPRVHAEPQMFSALSNWATGVDVNVATSSISSACTRVEDVVSENASRLTTFLDNANAITSTLNNIAKQAADTASSPVFIASLAAGLTAVFTDSPRSVRIIALTNLAVSVVGYARTYDFLKDNVNHTIEFISSLYSSASNFLTALDLFRPSDNSVFVATAQGPDLEILLKGLSFIGSIIAMLVLGRVSFSTMDFDKFLRRASLVGNSIRSVQTLFDYIQASFVSSFAYCCEKMGIANPINDSLPEDIRDYCSRAIEVITRPSNTTTFTSDYAAEVHVLMTQGDVLRGRASRFRYPQPAVSMLQNTFDKVYRKNNELASLSVELAPRLEPIIVYVTGEPGVGKSGFIFALTAAICVLENVDPAEWTKLVYQRIVEGEYWDGANSGHKILWYDEYAQRTDTANAPNPEIMEVLKLVNIVPYSLHMAGIEEKGKIFANYSVIIITSNVSMPALSIEYPEAFHRRICNDFHVTVKVKPQFRVDNSPKLDVNKVKSMPTTIEGKLNPSVYELHVKCTSNRPMVANTNPFRYPYSYKLTSSVDGSAHDLRDCYNVYDWYGFLDIFAPAYKARAVDKVELSKSVVSIGADCKTHFATSQGPISYIKSWFQYSPPTSEANFHDALDPVAYANDFLQGKCAYDPTIIPVLDAICHDGATSYSGPVNVLTFDEKKILLFNLFKSFNTGELSRHVGRCQEIDHIYVKMCVMDIASKKISSGVNVLDIPSTLYAAAQEFVDFARAGSLNPPLGSWNNFFDAINVELYALSRVVSSLSLSGFVVSGMLSTWESCFFKFFSIVDSSYINNLSIDWDVASKLYVTISLPASNLTPFEVFFYRYQNTPAFFDMYKNHKNKEHIFNFLKHFRSSITAGKSPRYAFYMASSLIEGLTGLDEHKLFVADSVSLSSFVKLFGSMDYWTAFYHNLWAPFSWTSFISSRSPSLLTLYSVLGSLPLLGQAIFALLAGGALCTALKFSVNYIKKWWFGPVEGEAEIKQSALDYVNKLVADVPDPVIESSDVKVVNSKFITHQEGYPNAVSKKQHVVTVESRVLFSPESSPTDFMDNLLTDEGIFKPFPQGLADNCTEVLLTNKFMSNLYTFCSGNFDGEKFVRDHTFFTGWFVCGTTILTCGHFIPTLKFLMSNPEPLYLVDFTGKVVIPINDDTLSQVISVTDKYNHPTDIALVCLNYKLVTSRPSIRGHFLTNAELARVNGKSAILAGMRQVKSDAYLSVMNNLTLELSTEKNFVLDDAELSYSIPSATYNHASYIAYVAATKQGDCGSLLLMLDQKFKNKIAGLHVAGSVVNLSGGTKGYGFSVPVSKERLDSALSLLDRRFISSPPPVDRPALVAVPNGGFIPLGLSEFVSGKVLTHNFGPSVISGVLQEPKFARSVLGNYVDPETSEIIDVRYKSLAKAGTMAGQFDVERLSHVSDSICDMYYDLAVDSVNKNLLTPLDFLSCVSDEVAIKGDGRFSSPLVLSTSAGLPWIHLRKGLPGKRTFISEDGVMNDILKEAVDASIAQMSSGKRAHILWQDLCKSERRPLAKVAAGKTRTIVSSPVHFTVILRKFLMFFLKIQVATVIKCQSSIGANIYSFAHGHGLATFLREKGTKFLAGDFQEWDGHNSYQALIECMCMVNKLVTRLYETYSVELCATLGVTEDQLFAQLAVDNNVREMCSFDIASSVHAIDNNVYMWTHGMPSGCLLTASFNTLLNQFYFYYAWDELAPPKFRGFRSYLDHVRANFQGDDNVLGVSDEAVVFYNHHTLQSCFARKKLIYTDALKTGTDMPKYLRFDQISYLKRSPIFANSYDFESPRWVWGLDQDVIREMPNWVSHSDTQKRLIPQVVDDCLRESSIWGEDFFNENCDKLRIACRKHRIPFHSDGFIRTRQFVLSGEYQPFC